MSRKHFVGIAEAIRTLENPDERKRAALALAYVCGKFSQHFDRARFMAACGVA